MESYTGRQLSLMEQSIRDFENGTLSLNSLVQTVEALVAVIDDASFGDALFPIILTLEEGNAVSISERRKLTKPEFEIIEKAIKDLRSAISSFRQSLPSQGRSDGDDP